MNGLKKIFTLSKLLANTWVKKGKIEAEQLTDVFSKEDADLVVKDINNNKEKRDVLLEGFKRKKDWKSVEEKITIPKKTRYISLALRVASVVIIAVGGTALFKQFTKDKKHKEFNFANGDIVIQLADGNTKVIDEKGAYQIVDVNGKIVSNKKDAVLDYSNKTPTKTTEVVYNELFIPYGKTFQIIMSDNTKVTLNSGSRLKYPVQFSANSQREVFLEGEAYFEVASDKNRPFIVTASGMNVRVLGTKFNVSSYPEEKSVRTVLVEGAVSLYEARKKYDKEKAILLNPGEKGIYKKDNHHIKVKKVDTSIYTAWVDGNLLFKASKFKRIVRILERHYNVEITNLNKVLGEQLFTATFNTETIETVLKSFQLNYPFSYKIEGNKITIN